MMDGAIFLHFNIYFSGWSYGLGQQAVTNGPMINLLAFLKLLSLVISQKYFLKKLVETCKQVIYLNKHTHFLHQQFPEHTIS